MGVRLWAGSKVFSRRAIADRQRAESVVSTTGRQIHGHGLQYLDNESARFIVARATASALKVRVCHSKVQILHDRLWVCR